MLPVSVQSRMEQGHIPDLKFQDIFQSNCSVSLQGVSDGTCNKKQRHGFNPYRRKTSRMFY